MDKDINYWIEIAEYDIETAQAMFKTKRYLYVLFMCQQAVEKTLKALVTKETEKFPPKTHDLIQLVELTSLKPSDEQKEILAKLTFYYIETRYPEEIKEIRKSITNKLAQKYLEQTREIIKWIKKKMK